MYTKLTVIKYNKYVEIMNLVKKRIKTDKEFVKIVSKMIHTKQLSESDDKRLVELLGIKKDEKSKNRTTSGQPTVKITPLENKSQPS